MSSAAELGATHELWTGKLRNSRSRTFLSVLIVGGLWIIDSRAAKSQNFANTPRPNEKERKLWKAEVAVVEKLGSGNTEGWKWFSRTAKKHSKRGKRVGQVPGYLKQTTDMESKTFPRDCPPVKIKELCAPRSASMSFYIGTTFHPRTSAKKGLSCKFHPRRVS